MRIVFDGEYYRKTIRDIAKMFCSQALEAHKKTQLTPAELTRLDREANKDQMVEEAVQELVKDGLIINRDATLKELPEDGEQAGQAPNKGSLILQ